MLSPGLKISVAVKNAEKAELNRKSELLDRYRARVATFPEGIEMLKEVQTGKGMVYYNNPLELINRLELLGGSIKAGNNSVKNEFSGIAHKLRDLGSLNNKQLSSLLKNYIL